MEHKFIHKILVGSIILSMIITIIAGCYSVVSLKVEEQVCYETLLNSSEEACSKIENNFKNDRASLRMLAKVIAQSDKLDSNIVINQLSTYAVNNYINNIAIITPDNKIIQSRHINVENNVVIYDEEIIKGEHISNLQKSILLSDKYILRNYVPIGNNSQTKGMLFTELDTDALAKAWRPSIYDGKTTFCIVDRETKEFIINNLGENYKTLDDITNVDMVNSIINSDEGYGEISINNVQTLVAYRPMSIENWDVLILIEKNIVLKPVNTLGRYLVVSLCIGTMVFILYIIWIIKLNAKVVHETKETANMDVLTGLQNRTSYEDYCNKISSNDKIVSKIKCIYIDVNGLHEINNSKGHLAGDMMLRLVAEVLKENFTEAKLYRIGGDEFVIFSTERLERVRDIITEATSIIVKNEYHISYGLSYGDNLADIIKDAEVKMYEMKKAYYESLGKEVRNKLEE